MTKKEVKNKLKQWGFKIVELEDNGWIAENGYTELYDDDFKGNMTEKKVFDIVIKDAIEAGKQDKSQEIRQHIRDFKKMIGL